MLANSTNDGLGIRITVTNTSKGRVGKGSLGTCSQLMDAESREFRVGNDDPFPIFLDEQAINVRLLPDRSIVDIFVQGGRLAGTLTWGATPYQGIRALAPRKPEDSAVVLWSETAGVTADVDVHSMGCGWVNPSYTEHPTM